MKKAIIIGIIPKYSENNIYTRMRIPPLGILSILSQIKDKYDVFAIDENNYAGPKDKDGKAKHSFILKKEPAKMALFYGSMSNSIPRAYEVARQYKKFGAVTIVGGSHVDAMPEEALISGMDVVVHGEGEYIIKELTELILPNGELNLNYKKSLHKIKGISYLDKNNKYVFTGKRPHLTELDPLVEPDLTLVRHLKKKFSNIPLNRGRGCNFNCEFCVVNDQYGKYKASSAEKVFKQMIKYSDLGFSKFFFTDDNFAQNVEETIKLCNIIGDYGRDFKKKIAITVQVRTEVAENNKLIKAMKYAGINSLAIGFESPIDDELKAMKKGVTLEKLTKRARKLSESFYIHGMFIFSYPSFRDSKFKSKLTLRQKAKKYKKFFRKARLDTVQILNAVPLPGSRLRKKLKEENRLFPLNKVGWEKYDGQFLCYKPEKGIDVYELQNLPRMLMKEWYIGDYIEDKINWLNWMDWAYYSTVGFLIQYPSFLVKSSINNWFKGDRKPKTLFVNPWVEAMRGIKRKWRNLAIRTYGRWVIKDWFNKYKKSDFREKLRSLSQ